MKNAFVFRSKGFTVVELLIVVVIVGILATIVLVSYSAVQAAAIDKSVLSDTSNVASELTRYQTKNNGHYSTDGSGSAVRWYSGGSSNPNISVSASSGNIIDVVANNTAYCIRAYNPAAATYKTLATAFTEGDACEGVPPSTVAIANAGSGYEATLTWTQLSTSGVRNWYSVASSQNGANLVAGVWGSTIYTSTDYGATWTSRAASGSRSWVSVASSYDGSRLTAAASGGYIFTSADYGVTWTQRTTSGTRQWKDVVVSADGTKIFAAVATGSGASLYTSTDSGATWVERTAAGSRLWNQIAMSSDGTKLAAAVNDGEVYTSTDSGVTWGRKNSNAVNNGVYMSGYSIASSADGNRLIAGGLAGVVYVSSDAGTTWSSVTTPASGNFASSMALSADGIRAAGINFDGSIYTSIDYGSTWKKQDTLATGSFRDVSFSPDGLKLLTGHYGGYLYGGAYN